MSEVILEALKKMDPQNDNHWTMNGEPKLDTVKFLSGGTAVTREELNVIAPGFTRQALQDYVNRSAEDQGDVQKTQSGDGAGVIAETEVKQPEMADTGGDREAEIEALASKIDFTNEEVLRLQRIHDDVRKELTDNLNSLSDMQARMQILSPPAPLITNIKAYLERSKEKLARRAGARKMVAQSGANLSMIQDAIAPSPLDARLQSRPRNR